jgi:hypothetical protein
MEPLHVLKGVDLAFAPLVDGSQVLVDLRRAERNSTL